MTTLRRRPGRPNDAPTLQIDVERNSVAPSLARAAVVGFFQSQIDASTLANLTLIVSELVSNAVAHSDAPPSSPIGLSARLLPNDVLRVEVTDQGNGFTPVPRDPNQHGGGYGLYIIDKQSTCWGVEQHEGTRVWLEMACPPSDQGRGDAGPGRCGESRDARIVRERR
jgi:anti-sigma regulatory factor (Ser/Thr protein kinase)